MDDLNISELLKNEIEKVHRFFNPPKENDPIEQLSKIVSQISNEVISKIEKEIIEKPENFVECVTIFLGLLNLVNSRKLSLDQFWANQVFNKIDYKLDTKIYENHQDTTVSECISRIRKTHEIYAIEYFRRQINSKIEKFDLPKSLIFVKKLLADKTKITGKFEEQALLQLKDELETEISFQREELSLREEFEKLKNKSSSDKSDDIGNENSVPANKRKDLTQARATLFFNYLLTEAKANCHNTKKAKVISFLTGYSENTIGDKLSNLHSKADKNFVEYEKDMKIVRQYFEILGLTEIVKKIDRDLKASE